MSNVRHTGKPDGTNAIRDGEPFGDTFQRSTTHAPTLKGSDTKPRGKEAVNGVFSQEEGATFTVNKPAVDFPSKPAPLRESKVLKSTSGHGMSPPDTIGPVATGATGSKTYPLKPSYEKRGRRT